MQDTVEFELPLSKSKVVIKGFITKRQDNEIQRIVNSGYVMGYKWDEQKAGEVAGDNKATGEATYNPSAQLDAEEYLLKELVVSIDGNADNLLDKCLDMKPADADFIVAEINKVTKASRMTDKQKKS